MLRSELEKLRLQLTQMHNRDFNGNLEDGGSSVTPSVMLTE